MKNEIIVSVVVPTLNEAKFIASCLNSISNQTVSRDKYEIILSDSSSVDNTIKIAKRIADKVVVCKRQSAGFGRNFGAKFARGKYLAFVDGDTIVSNKWIEGVIEGLEKGVACTGPVSALEKDSIRRTLAFYFWQGLTRLTVFVGHGLLPGHNLAIRREAFVKLGGFLEGNITNEDNDLSRKARKLGKLVYCEKMSVKTSTRRLKKVSMIAYFLNGVKFFLFGKSMTWNEFRDDY
ncbi:MAG: glycosyltransferase [archaeon]|jgi:glycosyltransferase involved in cell wall biosynthesis